MSPKPDVHYSCILFCTDFSDNADFAFHYALASAQRCGDADLHILHVLPEPEAQFWRTYLYEVDDVDAKARADMDRKIKDTYLHEIPETMEATIAIRKGIAPEQILDYAREIDADLIVMGRQGSSSLTKPLFGNVTEKIARKANCPVLIIPYSFEKKVQRNV